ncbi:MAG: hypothetical protein V1743_05680 [Nanoarchaeota archaeon]
MSTETATMKKSHRKKRGQTFSIDYIIGMLLFIAAFVISIKLIINQFPSNSFERLNKESYLISEMLISTGYPESWDNNTIIQPGLTTRNKLNMTKLRNLYRMDFGDSRRYFRTSSNYFITIEDKDYGIMYFNQSCGYGESEIRNNGSVQYHTVAYYYPQEGGDHFMLLPLWNSFQADVYYRDRAAGEIVNGVRINGSLDSLITNISSYQTIILEDPHFDTYSGNYSLAALATEIEDWVSRGNVLILTEQVGIDPLLHVNFPAIPLGSGNSTFIVSTDDDIPFEIGDDVLFTDKFTVSQTGDTMGFLKLSNYTNGETGIAKWSYGDGKVIYFPDISGSFNLQPDITEQVNETVRRTALGSCEGLDLSKISYKNMVSIDRYVIFNDKLAALRIYLWDYP